LSYKVLINLFRAIVDELGRGTSTQDGLTIAIAIAEALIDSKVRQWCLVFPSKAANICFPLQALVWFATHFRDLATVLAERNGVVNLHLAVEVGRY
jgi:DNA mismatch repair protein MSH4